MGTTSQVPPPFPGEFILANRYFGDMWVSERSWTDFCGVLVDAMKSRISGEPPLSDSSVKSRMKSLLWNARPSFPCASRDACGAGIPKFSPRRARALASGEPRPYFMLEAGSVGFVIMDCGDRETQALSRTVKLLPIPGLAR